MEDLRVQILSGPDESSGGSIYASTGGDPGYIELAAGDGPGARYTPILDLGSPADPARHLFVVGIDLEPGHEDDFDGWYNTEHLPALAQVPGVNRAVRYRRADPDPDEEYPQYLALYDITSADIAGNGDWVRAVETPWTNRVRPYFQARWRRGYRLREG